jgi:hypothetical protein
MEPAIAQRVGKLKVDATNEKYKQVTKKKHAAHCMQKEEDHSWLASNKHEMKKKQNKSCTFRFFCLPCDHLIDDEQDLI